MSDSGPAEPIRLQMFVNDLSATGVVRNAIAIANGAARSGFAVRLLTSSDEGTLRHTIDRAVELVPLVNRRVPGQSRRDEQRRTLLSYRRETRAWRPHVLFSAGNHGHLLSVLAWAGLPGAKVLRISNDLSLAGRRASTFTRLKRRLKFRFMTGRADRLVLVSEALARHPLFREDLASGRAVLIPNGVSLEEVRAGAAELAEHPFLAEQPRPPLLLAMGRHVPEKNFAVLLEAFAVAGRSRSLRLIIIGTGQPAALERIAAQAAELGIADQVDFLPPDPNPFRWMAAAAAFVLPSRREGSSNVLLEAMACGTPVIASRAAGNAEEVLAGGKYGLLFDPADPQELAAAILRQCGNNPVRPGERAQHFSRADAVDRYMRLFWQLAGRPLS